MDPLDSSSNAGDAPATPTQQQPAAPPTDGGIDYTPEEAALMEQAARVREMAGVPPFEDVVIVDTPRHTYVVGPASNEPRPRDVQPRNRAFDHDARTVAIDVLPTVCRVVAFVTTWGVRPLIVTKTKGHAVNGRVMLDPNDPRTEPDAVAGVRHDEGGAVGTWHWPKRE